jgi:2-oxoglutarate ferredoxin oxidoreductase subunit beta
MAELGIAHEKFAVISGIGCSSRFPYYMSTFGFHSIHGRAAAIATGVKLANPDLSVWVMTGDGDALAIGGNHFIHVLRRNVDLNIVLFNNKIYGLTKGQYSPTSNRGMITKTSPFGTIEEPFCPGLLAIGAGAKFFARAVDNNVKHTQDTLREAALHKGTSLVEVLQNCVIFNDGAHAEIANLQTRAERQLFLQHGKPMLFGANNERGIVLDNGRLKAVTVGENGVKQSDILVHDATTPDPALHIALIQMSLPDLPVAMGVIRNVEAPVYDAELIRQIDAVQQHRTITCTDDLLRSGNTWEVKKAV